MLDYRGSGWLGCRRRHDADRTEARHIVRRVSISSQPSRCRNRRQGSRHDVTWHRL